MSDYNDLVRYQKTAKSTAIMQYPSGKFGLCGSMPIELTVEKVNNIGQTFRDSQVWQTEQEVIEALLAIGVTRFQLSDCSWYN